MGKLKTNRLKFLISKDHLTLKGKIISGLMARKLHEKEKSPGVMMTSPAFRALETALIFAGEFGIDAGGYFNEQQSLL